MPLVSLAALTILAAGPSGQIRAAHAAGFKAVGLRLNPLLASDPQVAGTALAEEVRDLMRETGMALLEVGVFPIKPDLEVEKLRPVLALSSELGGRFIVCPVEDADEARALALATQRKNCALVIDLLHLSRSGGTLVDLRAVEPHLLKLVHFCDAAPLPDGARSIDELRAESRTARRLPGDGVLPLREWLDAFPDDTPISVEAPSKSIAELPFEEQAKRVLEATMQVVSP